MDIIDKFFSKIKKDQAPASLRAEVLDIPDRKRLPNKFWRSLKFVVPAFLIVVLVLGGVYYKFFSTAKLASAFELSAEASDSAGIFPDSTFILKSSKSLSAFQVKRIIKFDPETDFEVQQLSTNRFRLKPKNVLSQDQIYAVTIQEGAADRDYSWAFQVKAPFLVLQTHPRNQATYVPINSGIEITFNREGLIEPEKYFEIFPKVEGRFETHGDTLVFIPKGLQPRSIYQVTVKSGLKIYGSNDQLTKDFSFAFETADTAYYTYSSFDFNNDFLEFIPGKKPTLELYYYNVDLKNAEASIYKFAGLEEFMDSYRSSRSWDWAWASFYRQEFSNSYTLKNSQKIASFKPTPIKVGYQDVIELPDQLSNGYYMVELSAQGKKRQAWLQVTPIAHYFSVTENRSLIWVQDFQRRLSISNVSVDYYDDKKNQSNLGSTDAQGLIEFNTPQRLKAENQDAYAPQFFVLKASGMPQVAVKVADRWGYRGVEAADDFWKYLATDRYTYQINDEVKFWGVVKGRSQDIRGQQVIVGIYKPDYFYGWYRGNSGTLSDDNKPLVSIVSMISAFDTISGKLSFQGLTPGTYSVIVSKDDRIIINSPLEVLTYTKPAYTLSVTPSKSAIYADDSVTFNVAAKFFDGTPVSDLKLKYNAYWGNSIQGELQLDSNGQGQITYTPKYEQSIYSYYPSNLTFTFSPALAEEGEISGSGSVLVFGPNLYLQSSQKKTSEDNYTLTAKVNHIEINKVAGGEENYYGHDYIGNPVSGVDLTATIIKITYEKREQGQYYDPIGKTSYTRYEYYQREEIIEKLSGRSDLNGEWSFARILPKQQSTVYRIEFNGVDSKGRRISSITYGYYATYPSWQSFGVSLSINGEAYEKQFSVGDNVKLELRVLEGDLPADAPVLYYRYQNSIDRVVIKSSLAFEERFDQGFVPSVQYQAVVLGPYGFVESNAVMASYNEAESELKIQIQPDKPSYRPAEKANLTFKVFDKNQKPVSAELNVAVVDEAVFHVLPYSWQEKILEGLYRNVYIRPLSGYTQYAFLPESGSRGGAEGGGCFLAGTPILLLGGKTKPIDQIKVGDQVMTFSSEQGTKLAAAVVQGISRHQVDEYLVINGNLKVTPEHKLFVNDKWQYAGAVNVGDVLIRTDGKSVTVKSVNKVVARQTDVYNIVVGTYHTYFAGGFYVHNAEKGGTPRANFVDTASFQTLHTNSSGEGQITFTLPDNITSWRVTARAFEGGALKAGQQVQLVPTSLPFFADAVIGDIYLAGDSPKLKIRVFGTDYKKDQLTEFTAKGESLNLNQKVSDKNNTVYIDLGKLPVGEHALEISAVQGALKDSVIKKIKVVDSYFQTLKTSTYQVTQNLSEIQGNSQGFTQLTFMDAGKAKYFQALYLNTFISGTRADQAAARYYGAKLLDQYFGKSFKPDDLDLSPYNVPDSGLSLFSYSDADLALSSQMADLVPEFVYQSQLKNYFRSVMRDEKADIHRIAKALYGLSSLKEPVLVKLQLISDEKDLNLEDKIYVALGFAKLGDKETARRLYEADIRPNLRFEGLEAWLEKEADLTKRVKTTSLIAVLSSYINRKDDTKKLWDYLEDHTPQRELNVMEKTLFMKSELAKAKDQQAKFSYRTDEHNETVNLKEGQVFTLTLSKDELKSLRFSNVAGEIELVSTYEVSQKPDELKRNFEIGLVRKYFVNGQETKTFKEGDIVRVMLDPDFAQSAIDGQYQVVDYLPSGFRPVTRVYELGLERQSANICDEIWYPTKVIGNTSYFDIWKGFEKNQYCPNVTINYYARTVSQGTFSANPALIQSLKNIESLNISSKETISVDKRSLTLEEQLPRPPSLPVPLPFVQP